MRVSKLGISLMLLVAIVLTASATIMLSQKGGADLKGGAELSGPYDVVPNWPQDNFFEKGWTWGSTPAIYAQNPDRVFVYMRGELPTLKIKDAKALTDFDITARTHLDLISAVI